MRAARMEFHYLLHRSGYRCEYCRRTLNDELAEKDHIIPIRWGGVDEEWNLAISCPRCNRNKGDHIEWVDPMSGSVAPLFGPRTMNWADHFIQKRQEVIGGSTIGRATAFLLFRCTPSYLPPDLEWAPLADLRDNEPLYYFLNHARYRRLQNDFPALIRQLQDISTIAPDKLTDSHIAHFAVNLLLLEMYFTRSTVSDISTGISVATTLLADPRLSSDERKVYQNALSVLYQQRATVLSDQGKPDLAIADQRKSRELHLDATGLGVALAGELRPWRLEPEMVVAATRSASIAAKYAKHDIGRQDVSEWLGAIHDLEANLATTCYSYATDIVLSAAEPDWSLIERLYQAETDVLKGEGYGTTRDQARLFSVRRRWWALHLLTEKTPNWDLLDADLELWRRKSMFNELRELKTNVDRLRAVLGEAKVSCFSSVLARHT